MKMKSNVFVLLTSVFAALMGASIQAADGYPLANFALTVNASANGDLFGDVLRNPGQLGQWLQNNGSVVFEIEKEGKRHPFSGFADKQIRRSFPFVKSTYKKSPLVAVQIETQAFCPLGINDIDTAALPALLLELNITAEKDESFSIFVSPKLQGNAAKEKLQALKDSKYNGAGNDVFQVSCDSAGIWEDGIGQVPISLKAGEQKVLRFVAVFHDANWFSAVKFQNTEAVSACAFKEWNSLANKTEKFSAEIPATGDAELDRYLRWYIVPAVSLTKCTAKNEIVTMGYRELNQRDSYWTSWLHLVLFKDAERKMIEESIQHQQKSGKIPTTILPLIERHDDLDINAFFILRAARYYTFYKDKTALSGDWAALCKAMDWLISRDSENIGLPAQVSLWGDWKDVSGVQGRRYSPFSCLIYLAALKQMIDLSAVCEDADHVKKYEDAYKKGFAQVNRSVKDGGLWNEDYYCQVNKDGMVNDKLLQDQTVGILFGVVPREKSEKIIAKLNKQSLTPYGIAETTPYYPADFGYEPGTYHNGAVWPWLSFMDCWARIKVGHKDEAVSLIKRVAKADLVDPNDWSPNEHINSRNGKNLGFHLQGWNAGLFGTVYFGILEKEHSGKKMP